MITPQNLVKHELIGLEARVIKSTNKAAEGLEGVVIDETRNMLKVKTSKGEKTLAKDECTFQFTLPTGERVKVDGKLLVARPEDRVKKKHRRW